MLCYLVYFVCFPKKPVFYVLSFFFCSSYKISPPHCLHLGGIQGGIVFELCFLWDYWCRSVLTQIEKLWSQIFSNADFLRASTILQIDWVINHPPLHGYLGHHAMILIIPCIFPKKRKFLCFVIRYLQILWGYPPILSPLSTPVLWYGYPTRYMLIWYYHV